MSLRQSVALLKGCQKIAIGLMVLHAIGVLVVWVWALSRPHMVEPIEIRVANLIALWREGYLPYGFADRLPAVWNPYGFVYEWLCSLRMVDAASLLEWAVAFHHGCHADSTLSSPSVASADWKHQGRGRRNSVTADR
jgi:hypothetical protein